MKGIKLVGGIAGAACLLAATAAIAQEPFDEKLQAAIFNTKLVQALDECASPTTVINGLGACAPANVDTEAGAEFSVGKLLVKSRLVSSQVLAIVKSSPNADPLTKKMLAGRDLRVRLTLRISKRTTASSPTAPVTWSDIVLTCGSTAPPVPANGNFIYKGTLVGLAGCNLTPALSNEQYQKEVVSAEVIDATSGLALAVPGVRKK
jgi:hypothetical protein